MTRYDVAQFVDALFTVYIIILIAYIVITLLCAGGLRPGYSRGLDSVLTFRRDVSEPYLGLFRRFIPPLGPIDISPMVAILLLQLVGGLIISALRAAG